jgi:hypothetical protein
VQNDEATGEQRTSLMKNLSFRSVRLRLVEYSVTIFFVLIFFSLFAILMTKIFVPGTSLRQLVQKDSLNKVELVNETDRGATLQLDGSNGGLIDAFRNAAILTLARRDVKSKRADSIAWEHARPGMPLFNHDAVQTYQDSSAMISIDKRNSLTMGSNSLVIVKRVEKDPFQMENHSAMVLLEGELRGKIGSGDKPINIEVMTPGGVARLTGGTSPGEKTDFKVSTNRDESSSIAVFKGQAEIVAQGKLVKVSENMGVILRPGEAPGAPVQLPSPPDQTGPVHKGILYYRTLPPKVHFSWKSTSGVDAFHVQISRDPEFREIIVDKKTPDTDFFHGNLSKGRYYWRVSALRDGYEGRYSDTKSIALVQKLASPVLLVKFPSGPVEQDHFVLTGTTEPGVSLFLQGKPMDVSEKGVFSQDVVLKKGANLITVEAVDAAGNVAYRSQNIRRGTWL